MNRTKVLLVDDDYALCAQLSTLLNHCEFNVTHVDSEDGGLTMALTDRFDMIVLVTTTHTQDALGFVRLLRHQSCTPIILSGNYADESRRVLAYQSGADDVLSRPVNIVEMLLKIKVLARRMKLLQPVQHDVMQHHQLVIERRRQRVVWNEQEIQLTPVQFQILWALMAQQGSVLSKSCLYQSVLKRNFCRYDRSLDMHLSRIRKKLESAGMPGHYLVTVHGQGYRFA